MEKLKHYEFPLPRDGTYHCLIPPLYLGGWGLEVGPLQYGLVGDPDERVVIWDSTTEDNFAKVFESQETPDESL